MNEQNRNRIHKRSFLQLIGVFTIAVLALGALVASGSQVSAAPLSAPIGQCNNDAASNIGGQGLSCTITIQNFLTNSGTASAPSSVTLTRCVGAAGPVAAGAGTCTTTTSTSPQPITSITQCDGVSNGGGGVLICNVTMTNTFSSTPDQPLAPATVYQCIGSAITGPGAPGTCTPVNTPGVTSVTAATAGQCNGSGNGGTSVGFICTVTGGSTATAVLPVNIDQCNGSANGGGALLKCQAAVNSVVLSAPVVTPTPAPVVVPTPTPPIAPVVAPTVAPTVPPVAVVAPTKTPPPARAVPVPGLPSTSTKEESNLPVVGGFLLALASAMLIRSRRIVRTSKVTADR